MDRGTSSNCGNGSGGRGRGRGGGDGGGNRGGGDGRGGNYQHQQKQGQYYQQGRYQGGGQNRGHRPIQEQSEDYRPVQGQGVGGVRVGNYRQQHKQYYQQGQYQGDGDNSGRGWGPGEPAAQMYGDPVQGQNRGYRPAQGQSVGSRRPEFGESIGDIETGRGGRGVGGGRGAWRNQMPPLPLPDWGNWLLRLLLLFLRVYTNCIQGWKILSLLFEWIQHGRFSIQFHDIEGDYTVECWKCPDPGQSPSL